MSRITLTPALVDALQAVNMDVACDVTFEGGESYQQQLEIIAETCLDGGRMTMYGYHDADADFKRLVEVHGYDLVLKAAAEIVSVA